MCLGPCGSEALGRCKTPSASSCPRNIPRRSDGPGWGLLDCDCVKGARCRRSPLYHGKERRAAAQGLAVVWPQLGLASGLVPALPSHPWAQPALVVQHEPVTGDLAANPCYKGQL